MKPPAFWRIADRGRNWRSLILRPIGAIYASLNARRVAVAPNLVADVPVISVGNIYVGGTGKTPVVIALAMWFSAAGRKAHVVTRGYGGSLQGPVLVDERTHEAGQTGDEPLLISAFCPVWVSNDRAAGVRAAQDAGADVILLDDAHQNPDVAKSLSLVIVDAEIGFGNGQVMPSGPLREPIAAGLARADVVIAVGDEAAQQRFAKEWGAQITCPVLSARFEVLRMGMDWHGLRVSAFAGIGRPQKFFDTLAATGADIVQTTSLDDHQHIPPALLARLQSDAAKKNAQLVTTEKDAVRLPKSARGTVLTLPVRLQFDDESALKALLEPI